MSIKAGWEEFGISESSCTSYQNHRLKVPGGWLVQSFARLFHHQGDNCSVSVCFYPDPNHDWKLEN